MKNISSQSRRHSLARGSGPIRLFAAEKVAWHQEPAIAWVDLVFADAGLIILPYSVYDPARHLPVRIAIGTLGLVVGGLAGFGLAYALVSLFRILDKDTMGYLFMLGLGGGCFGGLFLSLHWWEKAISTPMVLRRFDHAAAQDRSRSLSERFTRNPSAVFLPAELLSKFMTTAVERSELGVLCEGDAYFFRRPEGWSVPALEQWRQENANGKTAHAAAVVSEEVEEITAVTIITQEKILLPVDLLLMLADVAFTDLGLYILGYALISDAPEFADMHEKIPVDVAGETREIFREEYLAANEKFDRLAALDRSRPLADRIKGPGKVLVIPAKTLNELQMDRHRNLVVQLKDIFIRIPRSALPEDFARIREWREAMKARLASRAQ